MSNADLEKAYWQTRLGKTGSLTDLRWAGYADLGGIGNTLSDREKSALGLLLGISEPTLSTRSLTGLRRQYRLSNLGLSEPQNKSEADLDYLFWSGTPFGPAISTPGDVPSGLSLWTKADTLAIADGGNVNTWPDSSAAGNNATEATTPPLFFVSGPNSKKSVYFDGATSKLSSPVSAAFSAQTIMAVIALGAIGAAGNTISGSSVSGGIQLRVNNGTIQLLKQGVGVLGASSASAIADANAHLVTATYDSVSGAYNIYVDQVLKGSGTLAQALVASTLTLGLGGTQFLNGYIQEYALWNRVLTGSELTGISNGLKSKWATP